MLELLVAQCRRPVVHVRELSIASRANTSSRYDLVDQNATSYLRQSGSLSASHTLSVKCEFYSHSRVSQLNTNAIW